MKESRLEKIRERVVSRLAKFLLNCKDVTPVIGESLERMLTLREKIVMKFHLLTCKACRNYLANVEFIKEAFQKKEQLEKEEKTAASLDRDARERIKNALKNSA